MCIRKRFRSDVRDRYVASNRTRSFSNCENGNMKSIGGRPFLQVLFQSIFKNSLRTSEAVIGTQLLVNITAFSVGIPGYNALGLYDPELVVKLAFVSIPSTIVGCSVGDHVRDRYLRLSYAAFAACAAVSLLLRAKRLEAKSRPTIPIIPLRTVEDLPLFDINPENDVHLNIDEDVFGPPGIFMDSGNEDAFGHTELLNESVWNGEHTEKTGIDDVLQMDIPSESTASAAFRTVTELIAANATKEDHFDELSHGSDGEDVIHGNDAEFADIHEEQPVNISVIENSVFEDDFEVPPPDEILGLDETNSRLTDQDIFQEAVTHVRWSSAHNSFDVRSFDDILEPENGGLTVQSEEMVEFSYGGDRFGNFSGILHRAQSLSINSLNSWSHSAHSFISMSAMRRNSNPETIIPDIFTGDSFVRTNIDLPESTFEFLPGESTNGNSNPDALTRAASSPEFTTENWPLLDRALELYNQPSLSPGDKGILCAGGLLGGCLGVGVAESVLIVLVGVHDVPLSASATAAICVAFHAQMTGSMLDALKSAADPTKERVADVIPWHLVFSILPGKFRRLMNSIRRHYISY